jgi:hypothetical protein
MGANAQTKVPTFASAEVLTAANTNLLSNGIGVFSGTATRDAAFGGSGEKVLAEGQFAYLEDSNTTQYYDGAAWQSVGVSPGLRLITAVDFSAVTSVSFAADTFSSTYRNYKVLFQVDSTSANGSTTARLRAAGSDNSTNNYRQMELGITQANATTNNALDLQTSFSGFGQSTSIEFDIFTPKAAVRTSLVGGYVDSNTSSIIGRTLRCQFVATTSFDSMSFLCSTGNFTGSYRVYGWADA